MTVKKRNRIYFALGQLLAIGLITLVVTLIANAQSLPSASDPALSYGIGPHTSLEATPVAPGTGGGDTPICGQCIISNETDDCQRIGTDSVTDVIKKWKQYLVDVQIDSSSAWKKQHFCASKQTLKDMGLDVKGDGSTAK